MPYIRQAARASLFERVYERMAAVVYDWSTYEKHGKILRSFKEFGGLSACPDEQKLKILHWMIMTYIGKPGDLTQYGNIRRFF
jgi:hypothetical protein